MSARPKVAMPPSATRIEQQRRREKIFAKAADGKSPKEIAYETSYSHAYVLNVLYDFGFRREYLTPTEWRIISQRRAMLSGKDAA